MSQQTKDLVEESPALAASPGMARLSLDGKDYELPVVRGSEGEVGVDIAQLRAHSGAITLDPGYGNTGACESAITFIDGDAGILRYRGYSIEDVAQHATFTEICYLLIYGKLPSAQEIKGFEDRLTYHSLIHEDMKKFFEGFPSGAHPMAMLSSMVTSLSAYYPDDGHDHLDLNIARLLAKGPTIAAFSYKKNIGQPFVYPRNDLSYCSNFLHMLFAVPAEPYRVRPVMERALNLLLILHADHEQNCSTSTVRMVGSSQANLFASISAGVCALWGPLHGGANQAVIEMLENIRADGGDYKKYVEMAKDKASGFRLMGFGHRVYKNFDPRAKILKQTADDVLADLGIHDDPLLEHRQVPGGGRPPRRLLHLPQALSQRGFLQRHHLPRHGHPHQHVHGDVRARPHARLDRPLERDAGRSQDPHQPPAPDLHRSHPAAVRAGGAAVGETQAPYFR